MFKKFIKLFLFSLIFHGFSGDLYAQASVRELKQQISNVKKEIALQQQKTNEEKQRDAEYQKTAQSRLNRLNTQINKVRVQKDSLKSELVQLKASSKKLKGASFWYTKKRKDFANFLASDIDSIVKVFPGLFPHETDKKLESLEGIATRLRSESIAPEEALDRVWGILIETLKASYEIESWKGTLTQSSGQLQGQYLRIGTVFQIFMVDKSDAIYILSKTQGSWQWKLQEFNIEERNLIRQAFKVKGGQANPQLGILPIPFYLAGEPQASAPVVEKPEEQ